MVETNFILLVSCAILSKNSLKYTYFNITVLQLDFRVITVNLYGYYDNYTFH